MRERKDNRNKRNEAKRKTRVKDMVDWKKKKNERRNEEYKVREGGEGGGW